MIAYGEHVRWIVAIAVLNASTVFEAAFIVIETNANERRNNGNNWDGANESDQNDPPVVEEAGWVAATVESAIVARTATICASLDKLKFKVINWKRKKINKFHLRQLN